MRQSRVVRRWAVAGLLACLAASAAQARGGWSFDIGLGLPIGGAYVSPAYGSYVGALPAGAVSMQVGGGRYWRHGGTWYRPWGPSWVVVAPPVVWPVVTSAPEPVVAAATLPAQPSRPEPVIYPRNGQGPEQTEADRQECNRWATTQPAALADSAVFMRAVEACMDGRGYTLK